MRRRLKLWSAIIVAAGGMGLDLLPDFTGKVYLAYGCFAIATLAGILWVRDALNSGGPLAPLRPQTTREHMLLSILGGVVGFVLLGLFTWYVFTPNASPPDQVPPAQVTTAADTPSSPEQDGPRLAGYFADVPDVVTDGGTMTVVLTMSVGNSGAASLANKWTVTLIRENGSREPLLLLADTDQTLILGGGQRPQKSIRTQDLLPKRTSLTRIDRNMVVSGYLVARSKTITQEALLGSVIEVRFWDEANHEYVILSPKGRGVIPDVPK